MVSSRCPSIRLLKDLMPEVHFPRRIPDAKADHLHQPVEGVGGKCGTRRLVHSRVTCKASEMPAEPSRDLRSSILRVGHPVVLQSGSAPVRCLESDGELPSEVP